MEKLKITDEFLVWLKDKAADAAENAAQGGRMDDGGANHTRELICAYTSGRDHMIPAFWIADLRRFHKEKDTEYTEYLRLKAKFERNP